MDADTADSLFRAILSQYPDTPAGRAAATKRANQIMGQVGSGQNFDVRVSPEQARSDVARADLEMNQPAAAGTKASQSADQVKSGASGVIANEGIKAAFSEPDLITADQYLAESDAALAGSEAAGEAAGTEAASSTFANVALPIYAAVTANRVYEHEGGKQIVKGQAKKDNWVDAGMASNPISGWVNPVVRPILGKTVGQTLFGSSATTKQIQADRAYAQRNAKGFADLYASSKADRDALKEKNPGWKPGDALPGHAADFQGKAEDGSYVNNKFATSRNEEDLAWQDVVGGTQMFETYGDDWMGKLSDRQRATIADRFAKDKLIQEKKGGLYYTGSEEQAAQIRKDVEAMKEDQLVVTGLKPAGSQNTEAETNTGSTKRSRNTQALPKTSLDALVPGAKKPEPNYSGFGSWDHHTFQASLANKYRSY